MPVRNHHTGWHSNKATLYFPWWCWWCFMRFLLDSSWKHRSRTQSSPQQTRTVFDLFIACGLMQRKSFPRKGRERTAVIATNSKCLCHSLCKMFLFPTGCMPRFKPAILQSAGYRSSISKTEDDARKRKIFWSCLASHFCGMIKARIFILSLSWHLMGNQEMTQKNSMHSVKIFTCVCCSC